MGPPVSKVAFGVRCRGALTCERGDSLGAGGMGRGLGAALITSTFGIPDPATGTSAGTAPSVRTGLTRD